MQLYYKIEKQKQKCKPLINGPSPIQLSSEINLLLYYELKNGKEKRECIDLENPKNLSKSPPPANATPFFQKSITT